MAKFLPDFRVGDTYRIKLMHPAGTDLTGYTHSLTLRPDFGAPPVLELHSAFGEHSADADQVAYLEAPAALTARIPPGRYVYDVQVVTASGEVVTVLPPVAWYKDQLFVAPQVTEDP